MCIPCADGWFNIYAACRGSHKSVPAERRRKEWRLQWVHSCMRAWKGIYLFITS